jgi:anthranilate phosphoribosyltransferase
MSGVELPWRVVATRDAKTPRESGENGGMTFDPRPYLKEIARGQHGARDLSRDQSRILFDAVFAGEVPDVALGALLVALRVKGESVNEIAGMMDALAGHVQPLRLPTRRLLPVIVPSYNGARKLPNLVPLMALMLAREGVPVLVHGAFQELTRVSTFHVLKILGYPTAESLDQAQGQLEDRHFAAVPVSLLSPALARLIDIRLTVGVRNSGHTLAKLLLPHGVKGADACRLIAVTHPEFLKLMREFFLDAPANVFFMRGVEGEAVVRLHAPQPIEEVRYDGSPITHLIGEGEAAYPLPSREAHATAKWTRDVLDGALPAPVAITKQVALILEHCEQTGHAARRALKAVPVE